MTTTIGTRITAAATLAAGSLALAFGSLALSAPASASSIQQTCVQKPGLYATGAVTGVYSTHKRGFDLDEICKVYGSTGQLLGTYTSTIYGYFKVPGPVTPPPVQSHQ